MEPIRVVVVDDSAVVRRIVVEMLAADPELAVVGTANDGRDALRVIEALEPDAVTLDIEMPEMDGVECARELHARWPRLPAVMFSTLSQRGATATLDALGAGAVDYVTKPSTTALAVAVQGLRAELIEKLKLHGRRHRALRSAAAPKAAPPPAAAPPDRPVERRSALRIAGAPIWSASQREGFRRRLAQVRLPAFQPDPPPGAAREPRKPAVARLRSAAAAPEVLLIGVSTGGPPALNRLLPALPATFRLPILLVQHMPPIFTRLLAQQLDQKCALRVVEAEAGMAIEPGTVYVAPGDHHMVAERGAAGPRIALHQGAPENSCRPAVDPLFASAARIWGGRALALVLTGMGQDGLRGARAIKEAGGTVLAQDEKSSVVWGMPGYVVNHGLADAVVPLDDVAAELLARAPAPVAPARKTPVAP